MARVITFETEGGIPYTLEYSRKAFVTAEKDGFSIGRLREFPLSQSEVLFHHGLLKNHRTISAPKAADLFDEFLKQFDLTDFVEFISEEYSSFFSTIQQNSDSKRKLQIQEK